ncbi:MAG TPA: EVE domain-containing protein [Phycisphaerae bacterium]|nr:EVE domain-containing protein [Phycisphaerae bacterium]
MNKPRHWLLKTEADHYSIDDLKRDGRTFWDGVRNYQARNFMRDEMQVGDVVLFWHSNSEPSGVAGIARVCKAAYPDHSAWDKKHKRFDPKSSPESPVWMMVDIEFVEKFDGVVSLAELRVIPALKKMRVLQRGQRLSVMPVELDEFRVVEKLGRAK